MVEVLPEKQNAVDPNTGKPRKNPDYRVDGVTTEIKSRSTPLAESNSADGEGGDWIKTRIKRANTQMKQSGTSGSGTVELQLRGQAETGLSEMERQVRANFNGDRGRSLHRVAIYRHSVLIGEWLRQADGTVVRTFPSVMEP